MSLRKLKTIALITLVAMLMASCGGGVALESKALKLTREQIQEAREKAAEESEGKDDEKQKPLPRVIPQISEDILFTLIYYVGISREDMRRAVILDLEDDAIEFIPTVRDFEYEILQNVSMDEAIYESEIFLRHEGLITNYYFKTVLGPDLKVIGYEIRPIYAIELFGHPDPLKIKYSLKRQRVSVSIGLKKGLDKIFVR